MQNNREHTRLPNLNVSLVGRVGTVRLRARLTDLSRTGLGLRTTGRLQLGQRLELLGFRCSNRPVLAGEVVWCHKAEKGYRVGVRCAEDLSDSWLGRPLLVDREHVERTGARFPTDAPVRLVTQEGTQAARLLDIGMGGAQLETEAWLDRGDIVRIQVSQSTTPLASVVGRRTVEGRQVLHLSFVRPKHSRLAMMRIICDVAPGHRHDFLQTRRRRSA
jgi:hypothetical protein